MVLSKDELLAALRDEVRIVLHLATKVDRTKLDYRPTPAHLRVEKDEFTGGKTTRGAQLVTLVLASCVAYRMQLFLYLKSCGRDELGTMNLWAGMDAPAPPAS